jgi:Flavodoxin-like fold
VNGRSRSRRLTSAAALIVQFPVWCFGRPAMRKGFFERKIMPGVACATGFVAARTRYSLVTSDVIRDGALRALRFLKVTFRKFDATSAT